MKKIGLVLLVLFIMPIYVSAEDVELITYDVEININENRTVNIDEEYIVNFLSEVNSIERKFTTELNYSKDSEKIENEIVVLDAKSKNSGFVFEDNILTYDLSGTKGSIEKYQIEYTYDYGIDKKEGYDDLYLNIIDGNYKVNISQIDFTINFTDVDKIEEINFYINGSKDIEEVIEAENIILDEDGLVTYQIEDSILTGSLSKFLEEGDTLSVHIIFEEDYFQDENDIYSSYWIAYLLIFPLLGLILGIFSWIKYGKGTKSKEKIKQDIESNYNSAEMAYIYKGYSKENDLLSVLIELANDGYLMFIEETDGYKLGSNNTFTIKKLKDYEDNSAIKKIFFDKFFFEKDEIRVSDIEYNLYTELVQAKTSLENERNKKELFNDIVPLIKKIILGIIGISLLIFTFYPTYLLTGVYFLFPIVSAVLFLGLYILFMYDDLLAGKLMFGLTIIAGINFLLIRPLIDDGFRLIIYVIGSILIYASSYMYNKLSTRTKKGNELYNIVHSYKNKLQKISSKKIKEDNSIYYKLYSYIYVFNMFDEWHSKGRHSIKEYPSWYVTTEEFSLKNFEKFIKNMIYVVTQAMYKNNGFKETTTHVEFEKKVNVKQME